MDDGISQQKNSKFCNVFIPWHLFRSCSSKIAHICICSFTLSYKFGVSGIPSLSNGVLKIRKKDCLASQLYSHALQFLIIIMNTILEQIKMPSAYKDKPVQQPALQLLPRQVQLCKLQYLQNGYSQLRRKRTWNEHYL